MGGGGGGGHLLSRAGLSGVGLSREGGLRLLVLIAHIVDIFKWQCSVCS